MLDPRTLECLPADHPAMAALIRAWARSTPQEREAFHRTTCLNSRTPEDLALVDDFLHRVQRQTQN